MSDRDQHWDSVYQRKAPDAVSWYKPHLDRSLEFIEQSRIEKNAAIIDVGGGVSSLAGDLVERGFTDITVLDLSEAALSAAKARLAERADRVIWIHGDITLIELPEGRYDFWHDRAVFHFLTDEEARRRYIASVMRSVRHGGHVVIATFGLQGPEQCSGLPVVRYDAQSIHDEFGDSFRKVGEATETHVTPWGSEQQFVYCYCRIG